jgi:hypothetical protein
MAKFDPLSVDVEEILIENHAGKSIDVTDLFVAMRFKESLYNPTLSGTIILVDAVALLENLPVIGQETLTITMSRGDILKKYVFKTTHVERQIQQNDFTIQYALNLVQESYYNNNCTLISQSYKGKLSNIIKDIYTEHLKVEEKDLDIEETIGNYSLVIPRWTPYNTIIWCARRARSGDNAPMFAYNTLNHGTKFKSLTTLFNQTQTEKYTRRSINKEITQKNTQRGDFEDFDNYVKTPIKFTPMEIGPTLESLNDGGYASRTVLIDTREHTYNEKIFNYNEEFDRLPHLAKEPMVSETFTVKDKPLWNNPDTTQTIFTHSSRSFGENYAYNSDALNISPYIRSYLNTLNNYRYRLTVSGRFDLHVGALVELEINKNRLHTLNDPDDALDIRRSGKHIITGLKHQFVRTDGRVEYTIKFECARDTMEKKYNAAV